MFDKRIGIIFLIFVFIASLIYFFNLNFFKETKNVETMKQQRVEDENIPYNSNIIKDVNYSTKDTDGNEYIINALLGEIDYANSNIIFLTNVTATIILNNLEKIEIKSDYGKYNSDNYDTIFSKNVTINYLENEIESEYLDFSLERNSMIISRNVIYKNLKNVLNADVVEINIKTKDTKIFMYEKEKKVNIKSKN